MAASRVAESPEQRQTRVDKQRTRQAAFRAARWTCIEDEALRYNPVNSYDNYPQFDIGRMNNVCSYCGALKWTGEAPGMCCFGGAVNEVVGDKAFDDCYRAMTPKCQRTRGAKAKAICWAAIAAYCASKG
ncbi:unnamed protein product [Didymodactylos carnosus]|uniref:Uncharacterized protein n=1 Tax=Didymodactylos carnosus TaxID=1234261 RepID=A0A8S2FIS6_9BILA|nr:unnamed protein product [Didymodactylos carnosus]CAF4270958.1 unnamed protein product [Didymodactylos carnosus]